MRREGPEVRRGAEAAERGASRSSGSVSVDENVSNGMNFSDPDDQGAVTRYSGDFRVVVSEHAAGTVVVPEGDLDVATAHDLEAVLATQSGPVVVDLRKLSFIDLAGLRMLLEADARSRQNGMNLRFIPGPMVRRLFELANLPDRLAYVEPRDT
jgi:anti-anti-sigma factor